MQETSHENKIKSRLPLWNQHVSPSEYNFLSNLFRDYCHETLSSIYRPMSTFATASKCIEKQSCLPVGLGLLAFLVILRLLRQRYIKQWDTKSSTLAEHSNDVGTVSAHRWLSLRDCLRFASTHCSSRSSYSKHVLLGLMLATIAQYCSDWLSRQATIIRLINKARVSVSRVCWILAACFRSSGTSQGSINLGKQLLVGLIFSRSISGRVVQGADIVGGPALTILLFIFGITYLEHRVPVIFARALKLANKDATGRDEDTIEKFLSKLFPADLSVDDTEHIRTWECSALARPQGSSIECNDLKNTVKAPLDLRYIITG